MGKFSTSWQLIKQSWAVLRADKELLWFPAISGSILLVVVLVSILPLFYFTDLKSFYDPAELVTNYTAYVLLFVYYLVSYFIITFFNAGLIACARIRLSGGNPTVRDGLRVATAHLTKILLWSAIAATVGVVLRIIADRSEIIGRIVASLLGAAWSLLTYFIVPVLIFEQLDVWQSIRQSSALFKRTWGENFITQVSFSLIFGFLGVLGFAFPLLAVATNLSTLLTPALVIMIVYWVLLGMVSASLQAIFDTALYVYATTGQVPGSFSPELLQQAFQPKSDPRNFTLS